jgi:hypothetical protein
MVPEKAGQARLILSGFHNPVLIFALVGFAFFGRFLVSGLFVCSRRVSGLLFDFALRQGLLTLTGWPLSLFSACCS